MPFSNRVTHDCRNYSQLHYKSAIRPRQYHEPFVRQPRSPGALNPGPFLTGFGGSSLCVSGLLDLSSNTAQALCRVIRTAGIFSWRLQSTESQFSRLPHQNSHRPFTPASPSSLVSHRSHADLVTRPTHRCNIRVKVAHAFQLAENVCPVVAGSCMCQRECSDR